jgi:hypothetical protein
MNAAARKPGLETNAMGRRELLVYQKDMENFREPVRKLN